MAKPILIDLYCGLGGWAEGFLAEDWDVVGFDIERHDYGTGGYPGQLVLQDALTLHGSQFKHAAAIVASPPCQKYSYMAMPWTRAKKLAAWYRDTEGQPHRINELTALFDACFRIQREASEAAGRHIPMVVENVKGAQPWVGWARWHFGSFYLWGDVPALMPPRPLSLQLKGGDRNKNRAGGHAWTCSFADTLGTIKANVGQNPDGRKVSVYSDPRRNGGNGARLTSPAENLNRLHAGHGTKNGNDWLGSGKDCSVQRRASSNSSARKAASAAIAKIPFPLAQHIARVFKPQSFVNPPTPSMFTRPGGA